MGQPTTDTTGRSLLRLTGTLMLIFGILGVVIYAVFIAVLIAANKMTGGIFSFSADIAGMGLLFAAALAELISGVLGRKAAKAPEKAGRCRVWGWITLILTLAGVGFILLRRPAGAWWQAIAAVVLGMVVPAVYLVGASRCRRDAAAAARAAALAAARAAEEQDVPAEQDASVSNSSFLP